LCCLSETKAKSSNRKSFAIRKTEFKLLTAPADNLCFVSKHFWNYINCFILILVKNLAYLWTFFEIFDLSFIRIYMGLGLLLFFLIFKTYYKNYLLLVEATGCVIKTCARLVIIKGTVSRDFGVIFLFHWTDMKFVIGPD
jgi:hypothetical protein